MTFLESLVDLIDPVASDPLSSSGGKAQTSYVRDVTDAVEDIRGALAGPVWRSAKAFLPVPTFVLDNGDAITNWVGVSLNSAIAVDTTVKTTGTGSVKIPLRADVAASKGYLNVPGTPSTVPGSVSKVRVAFDFRWVDDDSKILPADAFEFFISTAVAIGGTVTAFPIPYLTQSGFVTITLPIAGVPTLGSVGIRHKGAAFVVSGLSTPTLNAWIDNVRWEATELDVAIASASAVVVPADYTSAVPQNPITIPAAKRVIDLRPGYGGISGVGGVRLATEFGIVPGTSTNIAPLLAYALGQLSPGQTLKLMPGQYVFDGQDDLVRRADFTLDLRGVTLYRTVANASEAFFQVKTGQRLTFLGGYLVGFHTDLSFGSTLASVASNRLSAQQSDREDGSVSAEPYLWTALANSALGADTKNATRPKGVSTEIRNTNVGGNATIGMTLPTGASAPYDVEPSTGYTVFGSFRAHDQPATYVGWAARTCEISVKWYTAGGASAGTDSTVSGVEINEKTWKLVSGPVTSPATAAKASLEVRILAAAGSAGALLGEDHNVDLFGLQRTTARALTTIGTTITLTNPGDEVRLSIARVYGRDKDYRILCDFVLSDTAQVTGDVELLARDDETGEVLSSKFVTLTSTPATYQAVYIINNYVDQYNELARAVRFSVRKVKATTNTITITSVTEYNRPVYNSALENAGGIYVSDTDPDSNDILIDGTWFEGLAGVAVKFTSGGNRCVARNVVSRAGQFQGFALTGGADNGLEHFVVIGCGRSAVDIEPPAANRIVRRGFLRHGKIYRPKNAGIAWGPWAATEYVHVDDIYIWKQGIASNLGGKWSTVSNVRSEAPMTGPGSKDFQIVGLRGVVANVVCEYGWEEINTTANGVDDSGNLVVYTSSGNRLTNVTVRTGGGGASTLGDNFVTPLMSRGTVVAGAPGVTSFVVAIPLQTDTSYAVFVELGWHATPRITTRTTSSFTVETSVPVPVGGSSFNWMTAGV